MVEVLGSVTVSVNSNHEWIACYVDYAQANAEMRKALAFGVKDPKILHHASEITQHLSPAVRRDS